ncbi:MAG: MoaD/ThiS family protein [Chloroflexota bacterium]
MSKVHLEILSWLTETLDIEGNNDTISLEQEIEEGKTVSDLLNRLATRYPRFGQVVFDVNAQKLTERVSIFFNGRNLELANGLATRLSDGDTLAFVAPIIGG